MKRLVVCALLVGCGGDDSGGGTVALDDLGLQLANSSCSKMFSCCTDAEIMAQFMGITHNGEPITMQAQCVDFANAFFTTFAVAQYKESIAKGRMEYDGAAAADCLAFLNSLSCSEYSKGPEIAGVSTECRPFILPKVADGGACTQDYECTSDYCEGAMVSTGGTSTDGACKPLPAAGAACDDECVEGYYCGFDTSTGMEKCLALKTNGSQCSLDRECESDDCDDTSRTCVAEALTCDGR